MPRPFRDYFTWQLFKHFIGIVIGATIVSISINTLIIPNEIADGGATGISIILYYLFNWPVSWTVLLINLPLFFLGLRMVGRDFLVFSVVGVGLLSATLSLTAHLPVLTDDRLLAAISGGVLTGIGMGIIFRSRGSLGGTDILAVLLARTTSFSVGQILLGIDALIFLGAAILFRPEMAMYAMIYMFIATRVVDLVQEGLSLSKSVMVVTTEPQKISEEIMAKLERGVTLFQAIGAFSGENKQVVYCVINRSELSQIKEIVRNQDPLAFVAISEVPEVVGEGFSTWKGH
ncbi:YitT family protein [Desulfosporosinus sp.]|uniref:YitT family protein n=1 Tax=Desulfosporosinus sp. TaxID=157907 RepID=UPI000E83283E|nr:YitT family protein [Desulfosporosinus sp.]MBC2724366.1 YitT family protein [Desulfosporosinus sp.]MBC2727308.1 YitT family protein [Desulfosporosinus sp.]HBV86903.1 YitT family protein [Desulfosporosinus sp.]